MVFYPPLSLLSIPAALRPHSVRTVPLPCCQVRAKCLHLAALRWYCAAPPEPLPSPARCASPATPPLPSLHPSKWGVKGRSVNHDMKDATSRSRPSAHVSVCVPGGPSATPADSVVPREEASGFRGGALGFFVYLSRRVVLKLSKVWPSRRGARTSPP